MTIIVKMMHFLVLFLIQLETSFRNTNEHTLHR